MQGAKEEIAKTDPDTAANPLIFPDEETLAKVADLRLEGADNQEYKEQWQAVIGGVRTPAGRR